MLTSQIIYMKLKKGDVDKINGNHVHGLFYKEILASQNPGLADYLHLPENPKPFSISYIYKNREVCWFRIASWKNEIAQSVFSYFNSHTEINLSKCSFKLIKTSTENKESPWSARIDIENFINHCKATFKDKFWIEHFSPTSFKQSDSHVPLPVPELIINSIYRQLPDIIKQEKEFNLSDIIKLIHLKQHNLRSLYNKKNYGSIASFTGKTCWQIDKKASIEEKEFIWILFNFAFYSGIGVKTTQGMGMCRIL